MKLLGVIVLGCWVGLWLAELITHWRLAYWTRRLDRRRAEIRRLLDEIESLEAKQ